MSKVTVLPLTVTVTNPPVHLDLNPIQIRSTIEPLSVSTVGETVNIDLRPVQ